MVDASNLFGVSDAALVEELFRRHPNAFVVWGTNSVDETHDRQGNVLTVLGLIEHAKAKMLRPSLDELT